MEMPENDRLYIIKQHGESLAQKKKAVEELEAQISEIKQESKEISERTLPALMDELQISSIQLQDGSLIEVGDVVAAKIKDAETALQWLRETGNDSIIKNQFIVSLPTENTEAADSLKEYLMDNELPFEHKQGVHPQTLRAFVREALSEYTDIPRDAFGVFETRKVLFK